MQHLRKNYPEYPRYKCEFINCDERFATNDDKKEHMCTMHVQKAWHCPVLDCGKIFPTFHHGSWHRLRKHPDLVFQHCNHKGCETISLSEDDSQRHIHEAHPDRVVPCRDDDCPMVFLTANTEATHHSAIHCVETYDCKVDGCGRTFNTKLKLRQHLTTIHPDKPIVECHQHGCKEVFLMYPEMRAHMREAHAEYQAPAPLWYCPLKNCEQEFPSRFDLFNHHIEKHNVTAYECPEQGCSKAFPTKKRLGEHVRYAHKDRRPCPWPGCGKTFPSEGALKLHEEIAHYETVLKCSYPGCESTLSCSSSLNNHVRGCHPGWVFNSHACPAADVENCHEMFASQLMASTHANIHHHGKIPCRYRKEFSCEALFENMQEEGQHKRKVHSRYICNVPGCVSTVIGHLLSIVAWATHAGAHLHDSDNSLDSLPKPTLQLVPGSTRTDDEGCDIAIDRYLARDNTEGGEIKDDHMTPYFGSCFPLAQATSDLEEMEACTSSFQQRNQQLLREFPQARRNHMFLGLKCAGPSPINNLIITTVCPTGTTLDYTTTRIKVSEQGKRFRLPIRCFQCETNYVLQCLLKKHNLLRKAQDQSCSEKSCFQPAFQQSRLCKDHLIALRSSPIEFADYTELRALTLAHTWVADESVLFVFDLLLSIQAGNSNESELRFLDLEFNTSTKRIFEIGMCNTNGDLTLDCRTRYQPKTLAIINRKGDTKNTYMDGVIDRSTRRHHCVDHRLSARQVADRLREQGVSPRTWFVTWHQTTTDLSALRGWLESEGQFDVLPNDSRCLPIVPHIRRNLKAALANDGRIVPAALSVVFPLIMGSQHELVGRNHHAAADAQQACYLTKVYLMQSRHPADRPAGWLESLQKPKGSLGRQKRQTMIESSLLKARESAGVKLKQLMVEKSQSPKKP